VSDWRTERRLNPWHWFPAARPEAGGAPAPRDAVAVCGSTGTHLHPCTAAEFERLCNVVRVGQQSQDAQPRPVCRACAIAAGAGYTLTPPVFGALGEA
jgi:hypothetical protein